MPRNEKVSFAERVRRLELKRYHFWVIPFTAVMLAGAFYFNLNGGELTAGAFLLFCLSQALGQMGAGYECFHKKAWSTLAMQIYFFVVTAFGAVQRFIAHQDVLIEQLLSCWGVVHLTFYAPKILFAIFLF